MRRCAGLFAVLMLAAQIATGQPTTTFAYGTDPAQRVDAYLKQDTTDAPAIVMLHGGAWRIGVDVEVIEQDLSHWAINARQGELDRYTAMADRWLNNLRR